MKLGIVQTIELAASLIFAAPLGMFGISRLLDGDVVLGTGLVIVAALMVLLPQYLTTPGDVPGKVLGKVGIGTDASDGSDSVDASTTTDASSAAAVTDEKDSS